MNRCNNFIGEVAVNKFADIAHFVVTAAGSHNQYQEQNISYNNYNKWNYPFHGNLLQLWFTLYIQPKVHQHDALKEISCVPLLQLQQIYSILMTI